MADNDKMRALPSLDALLRSEEGQRLTARLGTSAASYALRTALCKARDDLLHGINADITYTALADSAEAVWAVSAVPKRVINAVGIALHTNLGRAPLAQRAVKAVNNAMRYSALEYDLECGERGERGGAVEALICACTGTEAAMVVNNNAAALLLALTALCGHKGAIISRGELVEIGGSFRVSDIAALGSRLIEVGTTNRTHLHDYEDCIDDADAILKVHTSNYTISGFTACVAVEELAELCKQRDIPLIYDIGSGAVMSDGDYPFTEPTVPAAVRQGADILTFSADKLLGAAQGGIICGKRKYIDLLRRHPLARAVRIDKLALAAIGATFELYQDYSVAKAEIPVLQMLMAHDSTLLARARRLQYALNDIPCTIMPTKRPVGGGSVPGAQLCSYLVAVPTPCPHEAAAALRLCTIPVIALVREGMLCLDIACIFDDELELVAQSVRSVLQGGIQ